MFDQLDEPDVSRVERMLDELQNDESQRTPVDRIPAEALDDEEPLTNDDREAIRNGLEDIWRGNGVLLNEVLRRHGFAE